MVNERTIVADRNREFMSRAGCARRELAPAEEQGRVGDGYLRSLDRKLEAICPSVESALPCRSESVAENC